MPSSQNSNAVKKKVISVSAILKSPITLGLLITVFFIYSAKMFYTTRDQNDLEKSQKTNWLYEVLEIADLKSTDLKFQIRGQRPVESPVALLTVDDASLEEIGRWPWSREKTAFVIDKAFSYGAKAVALDIIFSEPQESPLNPDKILSETLNKYRDKVVLGAIANGESKALQPFQDYCQNEAFKRMNGTLIVNPLNSSFLVDDSSDEFVDVKFGEVLKIVFDELERDESTQFEQTKPKLLAPANSPETRNRQLKNAIHQRFIDYCENWLTPKDPFINNKDLQKAYLSVFKESKILAGLEFDQAIEKFQNSVPSHPVPEYSYWTADIEQIQKSADFTASFNAEQDPDGSIRKGAMFFRTGNRIGTSFVPSLAVQAYLVATGYQARLTFGYNPDYPKQKIMTSFGVYDQSKDTEVFIGEVPVDKQGRLRINYLGASNTFPYVSAKELFTDSADMTISQREFVPQIKSWAAIERKVNKAEFLKDRVLLMGATAIGIYDLRVTPFDKNFPGLETHANVLSNLMSRQFLKISNSESRWMPWLIAFLGLLLTLIVSRSSAVWGFSLTLGLITGLLVLDYQMFSHGFLISMVIPLFMITNLFVILTVYKFSTEERKKRHLRQTFSKYVSPAIVDEILKDPENIQLGGKKSEMSVFFSDVRNFTSFSESLDPKALANILNEYLTPMTHVIFANKGTLDKYMGDAVMAFFGAPIYFDDHAACACRCALQSMERLGTLQKEFELRGLPHIDIGIGVNSAEMNVGNMGSDIVRSYTVMGDAVNLGSRLESANKNYGTNILISEFTYEQVKDKFTAREVDVVLVKGKKKPVKIYQLISEGEPPYIWKEVLPLFQKGYQHYQKREFAEAIHCFKKVLALKSDDYCSELYIERCENYLKNPPPESWEGVYEMTSK